LQKNRAGHPADLVWEVIRLESERIECRRIKSHGSVRDAIKIRLVGKSKGRGFAGSDQRRII